MIIENYAHAVPAGKQLSDIVDVDINLTVLVDVIDSNPNGDPDAEGRPRVDEMTGIGLISPDSQNRHIRDFVARNYGENLYTRPHVIINDLIDQAVVEIEGIASADDSDKKKGKGKKTKVSDPRAVRAEFCRRYWDARVFGAVLSTGDNPIGVISGPVTTSVGRSVAPVQMLDMTTTQVAPRSVDRAERSGQMGRSSYVTHGLYVTDIRIGRHQAAQTGMTYRDYLMLLSALHWMWSENKSSARRNVRTHMIVASYRDKSQSPYRRSDNVTISLQSGLISSSSIDDYAITVTDDENYVRTIIQ